MIVSVASWKITLPPLPPLQSLKGGFQPFRLAQISEQFMTDLKELVLTYNQQNPHRPFMLDSAAMHLFEKFLLFEVIKNSIDAGSASFHVKVYLDGHNHRHTVIQIVDDGAAIDKVAEHGEYNHIQALVNQSEKRGQALLGGAGKGLAMASLYLKLFGQGVLMSGGRPSQMNGYLVTLHSLNKPAEINWPDYFEEFHGFYRELKNLHSGADADFTARIEQKLKRKLLTQATICQSENRFGLFNEKGNSDSVVNSADKEESLEIDTSERQGAGFGLRLNCGMPESP